MKISNRPATLFRLALILAVFLVYSPAAAGSIQVITSRSTPLDSLDEDLIRGIFLGNTKSFPSGEPVEFVVLESGDVHDGFLKTYLNKSSAQFNTYWKKQVFTGKGKLPKTFSSEKELISYVSQNPGIIGYVSAGTEIGGNKVINEK